MDKDLTRLKEKKANPDDAKKLKKVKDELKLANKKTEETTKMNENLNIRLGQEVSARAHAEKEIVRLTQCQSALQLIIEKGTPNQHQAQSLNDSVKAKSKLGTECKDFNKPNGCSRGNRCRFDHVQKGGLETRDDCTHWMERECQFTDKACKYAHDPAKKGIKSKQTFFSQGIQQTPAQGLESQNMSLQDQVNCQVHMMLQQKNSNHTFPTFPMAGSASHNGGFSSSAQRMDGQSQVYGIQPTWNPQQLTITQMVQQALLQQQGRL